MLFRRQCRRKLHCEKEKRRSRASSEYHLACVAGAEWRKARVFRGARERRTDEEGFARFFLPLALAPPTRDYKLTILLQRLYHRSLLKRQFHLLCCRCCFLVLTFEFRKTIKICVNWNVFIFFTLVWKGNLSILLLDFIKTAVLIDIYLSFF